MLNEKMELHNQNLKSVRDSSLVLQLFSLDNSYVVSVVFSKVGQNVRNSFFIQYFVVV